MDLVGAMQGVVTQLQAAGLRSSVDERDINPPFVYVSAPTLQYRFGKGADAEMTVWACVPDSGRSTALVALNALVNQVVDALNGRVVKAEPADMVVPDQGTPLPAYRLSWTQKIT